MASISARHRKNSTVVSRSIDLARNKTSVSLEHQFWEGLREIAHKRNIPVAVLIEEIDNNRTGSNLSSSIRLFVLSYFKTVSQPSPQKTYSTPEFKRASSIKVENNCPSAEALANAANGGRVVVIVVKHLGEDSSPGLLDSRR